MFRHIQATKPQTGDAKQRHKSEMPSTEPCTCNILTKCAAHARSCTGQNLQLTKTKQTANHILRQFECNNRINPRESTTLGCLCRCDCSSQFVLRSFSAFQHLAITMVVSSLLRRSFACWEGWTGDWVMILVDYNMLRVPVNASARQVLRAFGTEVSLYHDGAWVSFDCVLSGLPLNTCLFFILEDTDDW